MKQPAFSLFRASFHLRWNGRFDVIHGGSEITVTSCIDSTHLFTCLPWLSGWKSWFIPSRHTSSCSCLRDVTGHPVKLALCVLHVYLLKTVTSAWGVFFLSTVTVLIWSKLLPVLEVSSFCPLSQCLSAQNCYQCLRCLLFVHCHSAYLLKTVTSAWGVFFLSTVTVLICSKLLPALEVSSFCPQSQCLSANVGVLLCPCCTVHPASLLLKYLQFSIRFAKWFFVFCWWCSS